MSAAATNLAPEHCRACGHPGSDNDPIVSVVSGVDPPWGETPVRVHRSHAADPQSGFYGATEVAR